MSRLRNVVRSKRRREIADLFAQRAERFQKECGWCGRNIDEDEPVFSVGGRVHKGVDLSLVEGKIIELRFEVAGKTVLAGVAGFDSDAMAAGDDIVFMTCSEECGRLAKAGFAGELARGLTIQ